MTGSRENEAFSIPIANLRFFPCSKSHMRASSFRCTVGAHATTRRSSHTSAGGRAARARKGAENAFRGMMLVERKSLQKKSRKKHFETPKWPDKVIPKQYPILANPLNNYYHNFFGRSFRAHKCEAFGLVCALQATKSEIYAFLYSLALLCRLSHSERSCSRASAHTLVRDASTQAAPNR